MSGCTFFGHHDCPASIKPKLTEIITGLINNQLADTFYVGNNGAFDRTVRSCLRELIRQYPQIRYAVVLERMPVKQSAAYGEDFSDTMLPEGIENVHPRFAVSRRNKWMLRQADYVVTYITRSWGGAAKFAEMAERQGKTVINLAGQQLFFK